MDAATREAGPGAGDWTLVSLDRLRMLVPRERVRAVQPCTATWLESADPDNPTWPADTGDCPVLVLDEFLRPAPQRLSAARQILLLAAGGRTVALACEGTEAMDRAEPPAIHRLPVCMAGNSAAPASLAVMADGTVASVMESTALDALAGGAAAHG